MKIFIKDKEPVIIIEDKFDTKYFVSELIRLYEEDNILYNLIVIDFNNKDISLDILTDIVYVFEMINGFNISVHISKTININKTTLQNIKNLQLEDYFIYEG